MTRARSGPGYSWCGVSRGGVDRRAEAWARWSACFERTAAAGVRQIVAVRAPAAGRPHGPSPAPPNRRVLKRTNVPTCAHGAFHAPYEEDDAAPAPEPVAAGPSPRPSPERERGEDVLTCRRESGSAGAASRQRQRADLGEGRVTIRHLARCRLSGRSEMMVTFVRWSISTWPTGSPTIVESEAVWIRRGSGCRRR